MEIHSLFHVTSAEVRLMERMMLWSFETGQREQDWCLLSHTRIKLSFQETHTFPLNVTSAFIPEQNSVANKIRVEKK